MTSLLKSANVPNFASTHPRFVYVSQDLTPGPGNYDLDCLERARNEEIKNIGSFSYKSNVKKCLPQVKADHVREQNTRRAEAGLLAQGKY